MSSGIFAVSSVFFMFLVFLRVAFTVAVAGGAVLRDPGATPQSPGRRARGHGWLGPSCSGRLGGEGNVCLSLLIRSYCFLGVGI